MSKNQKIILLIVIVITILLSPLTKVEAHSVELDPESLITMPYMIIGGSGTISIRSSVTDYTLYYQAVQISSDVYAEIEQVRANGETELEKLEEEYEALGVELDELEKIYDDAYDAYTDGLSNSALSATELEELKTAYETARTNYQNKLTEYNAKISEYNSKVTEINDKIKALTPTYVESNWTVTTDNKVTVDITEFSGEQPYVIWAKLVTTSGTYYDEAIYTMTGTKTTDDDGDNNNTTSGDNTVASGTLPQTGEGIEVIFVLAIIVIAGIIYKKYHSYKDIN